MSFSNVLCHRVRPPIRIVRTSYSCGLFVIWRKISKSCYIYCLIYQLYKNKLYVSVMTKKIGVLVRNTIPSTAPPFPFSTFYKWMCFYTFVVTILIKDFQYQTSSKVLYKFHSSLGIMDIRRSWRPESGPSLNCYFSDIFRTFYIKQPGTSLLVTSHFQIMFSKDP